MKKTILILATVLMLVAVSMAEERYGGSAVFTAAASAQSDITNQNASAQTPVSIVGQFAASATGTLHLVHISDNAGTSVIIKSIAVTNVTKMFFKRSAFDGLWMLKDDILRVSNTTAQAFTYTYSHELK